MVIVNIRNKWHNYYYWSFFWKRFPNHRYSDFDIWVDSKLKVYRYTSINTTKSWFKQAKSVDKRYGLL